MKAVHWKNEFIGGATTFFTLSYIFIVNPAILSTTGTGMPFSGVATATVVLSAFCTLLMGLYAKLPFAVAPGMGINAFFTYSLILNQKIPWPTALGMVFWAGIIFLIASLTPWRERIAYAIPHPIRVGAAAGIGLFLTFIGFQNAGLVIRDPVTLVTAGKLSVESASCLFAVVLAIWMMKRKNPFAFLAAIGFCTLVAVLRGKVEAPGSWVSQPDFSLFGKMDWMGALKWSLLPATLSIFFTDLFDSIATFVGVSQATGLADSKGNAKNVREGLVVDAVATFSAGMLGTSSGTAYIESAAGIEAGGRTGWTAVFCALFMLPCLFLAPIAGVIPSHATAPVLIVVGMLLFRSIADQKWNKWEEAVPMFLTMALIPLTFSITQGLLWGFLSYVVLFTIMGKAKEISWMLWGIAVIALGILLLGHA